MILQTLLSQHSVHLPDALQSLAKSFCKELADKLTEEDLAIFSEETFANSVLKVSCCSQFISESWLRDPSQITSLVQSGDLLSDSRREQYPSYLLEHPIDAEAGLAKLLRQLDRKSVV